MKTLPKPLKILINNLKRLPGIGEKTAERLSYYIIKQDDEYLNEFSHILSCIKHEIIFHGICGFFCDANNKCLICDDVTRQNDLICVVKEAKDVFSFFAQHSFSQPGAQAFAFDQVQVLPAFPSTS
mgnify:CR=1 FL=1